MAVTGTGKLENADQELQVSGLALIDNTKQLS
jgi:hypothetical protein